VSNRLGQRQLLIFFFGLGFLVLEMISCSGAGSSAAGPSPAPPSAPPVVSVPPPPATAATTDVVTYHNDNARTGQNLSETVLTPANVNSGSFGELAFFPVDGKVDGQPLYLSNLMVGGTAHNVLFVVTEHDSVFAFDADTGTQLWKKSVLGPGETPSDDRNCAQITPEIGITSTPVIDRLRGPNGAIYIVAMSKDSSGGYHQRIHALDITTGGELFGGPTEVQASYPGTGVEGSGGRDIFDPKRHAERVGLLLLNDVIYTGWTSHCDIGPYTGWLIGYDAGTLAQASVLNLTPNGSDGSIWMSGSGLAADAGGNIYFLDANGTFDTVLDANGFPSQRDFGNSFLKISTSAGLGVADYFAPFNTVQESSVDEDLGAGGTLLLPDLSDASGQVRHLAVGAGKDAHIYVVDRDAMGKFNPIANNNYQDITGALAGGVFSMPAYFNNGIYYGAVGDTIKAFPVMNARLATMPASQTANSFVYPGATPAVSANGTANAILWAVENTNPAVLHAYNATNLSQELYNSNQAGTRDHFGPGNKFITPTIVNGRVFVGTTNGVAVFGLLH
jgi:outer membrane protein assembly factor BamB